MRIYDGIDATVFDPSRYERTVLRRQYGIDPRGKGHFSMVARICAQKRQQFLLEALPRVLEKFPKALVLFVGEVYAPEAHYMASLSRTIKEEQLSDHVRFWGFERETAKIYALSDVTTLCTLGEGFGLCLIEAMAMGCPVVAPNRAGPTELIKPNEEGLLYDPKDPKALAAALIQSLSNPSGRYHWIQNGFKKARQLDISKHVTEVARVYDTLLHG